MTMANPRDRLITNLRDLARLLGSVDGDWKVASKAMAAATGLGYHGFWEILVGIKLPSGEPKSVGHKRLAAIERAFGPLLPSGWFAEEGAVHKYVSLLRLPLDLDQDNSLLPPASGEHSYQARSHVVTTAQKPVPSVELEKLGRGDTVISERSDSAYDSLVICGNFGAATFKAEIVDNSMSPDLREGDAIVVDAGLAAQAMTEDMVVVRAQTNDRVFVGWYFERLEGGFYVKPVNRGAPEVDGERGRLLVLGVVIDRVLRGRTCMRKAA